MLFRSLTRYDELQALMNNAAGGSKFAQLSKEFSDLGPIVEQIQQLRECRRQLADAEAMVVDPEMRALAEEEFHRLKAVVREQEEQVQLALIPKDEADAKNAILEVRAGTGGDEAALFAADLFRMYQRYAATHGWKFEIMEISDTGLGGYKEAIASIAGRGVFARLKFESGVHRVQRVPATEASGRIHTSAATVAVLPEAEEVDIKIDDKDFEATNPGVWCHSLHDLTNRAAFTDWSKYTQDTIIEG